MKATATRLRLKTKELLDMISRGEEVIITYRGKACAKLIPYRAEKGRPSKHKLFGIWKDNEMVSNVERYVRDLRKGKYGKG
ncbi:MAG: type II toxin-antitoxin system prevent-host-death family antitoxin [Desulfobacteraceae bacterium]|nr:type II toxin-antitoxin system prevent-host-death family antitoxin [Desulfobacteraceae bacterium]